MNTFLESHAAALLLGAQSPATSAETSQLTATGRRSSASAALGATLLVAFLAACGGGGDAPPSGPTTPTAPTTPTTTTAGPPTSIAITAGDGQQGEPGAFVAVKPVVVVRDAAGRNVPGAVVSFVVDSGGGSVQSASTTTASDGTATPGDWRLGSEEARNILRASVASVTPVTLVATAAIQPATVATQTLPSSGGTIAIATGVLAGTKLVIPAGAYSTSATWKLDQRSNADWPRRRGVRPSSAAMRITSTDTALAAKPLLLTLPVRAIAGAAPFVLMRDRVTNTMHVLQTVSVDSTTITVAAQHFDASWMNTAPPAAPAFRGASRAASAATLTYDADVVVSSIPVAELDGDVDTGFRPGTDDWDFPLIEASMSELPGKTAKPALQMGRVLTEMAYFATMKAKSGPLFKKYRQIAEVPYSNKTAAHAIMMEAVLANDDRMRQSLVTIRNSVRAGLADQTFHDVLKANLIVSGLPQIVIATVGTSAYEFTAYRAVAGRIDLADPRAPGSSTALQFAGGRFAPFQLTTDSDGTTKAADWVGALSVGQFFKMSAVADEIVTAASGTDSLFWPDAAIKARGGFVEDSVIYLGYQGDSTRFWVECPNCESGMPSTLPPGRIEPFVGFMRLADGTLRTLTGDGANGYLLTLSTATDARVGFVMFEGKNNDEVTWLDFQWMRLKRWTIAIVSDGDATVGTPKTFTLDVRGPANPPAHEYVWTFGTGPTARVLTTTAPTVTTTFDSAGVRAIEVKMRRKSDGRVLTAVTGSVEAKEIKITLSPAPLIGSYDIDYTLTAALSVPTPANATWVWELGDNRTETTATNQLRLRYPAPSPVVPKLFTIKVTLKSGAATFATGQVTADIAPRLPVWKFTALTVEVSNPGPSAADLAGGWFGLWTKDVQRWQDIHVGSGHNDGGIIFLPNDTTIAGDAKKQGLYILDGASITPTTLARNLSFVNEVTFSPAPTGDSIRTIWHVYQPFEPLMSTSQPGLNESYVATGNITSGSVTGVKWIGHDTYNRQAFPPYFFPRYIRYASVTFNGNTASGTLEYVARAPMDFTRPPFYERRRWQINVTFAATRIQ